MPGLFDNTSGGGLFDTLGGIFSPQVAQQNVIRQTQQALYQSARTPKDQGGPGFSHAEAVEYALNQKAQEEYAKAHFGNPVSLGEFKVGDISSPVLGHDRGVMPNPLLAGGAGPGGGLQKLMDISNQQKTASAAATKEGEAQGNAKAGLEDALANADEFRNDLKNLKEDPNLEGVSGWWGKVPERLMTPTQIDTMSKINQLKGRALAVAAHAQKGVFGRIALKEAQALQDSMFRLRAGGTYQGMLDAIDSLDKQVVGIRTRAGQSAGVGPTPPAAPKVDLGGGWSLRQ